jgi:hypothetical protein
MIYITFLTLLLPECIISVGNHALSNKLFSDIDAVISRIEQISLFLAQCSLPAASGAGTE